MSGKGLIIATDRIYRQKNYTVSLDDDNLSAYIDRNNHRICVINQNTPPHILGELWRYPIVIMTTQRYFRLQLDEIKALTKTRHTIVFDERPYFFDVDTIRITNLNDIASAIADGLPNTINQDDKQQLINQWSSINQSLQDALISNEKQNDSNDGKLQRYFCGYNDLSIDKTLVNDFFSMVDGYIKLLNAYNSSAGKTIGSIKQLMTEGIITSQKKKSKKSDDSYDNSYTVINCNIDKLTNIGAKVIILDGTADISPDYGYPKIFEFINMVDCSAFKRDLSKLTINIVDVDHTSKNSITKSSKVVDDIIDYVKAQPLDYNTVFTYSTIENKFSNDFRNVNHFGNIKGSNEYRNETCICQVGVNRLPDTVYTLYLNAIGQINDGDNNYINNRIYDNITTDGIMSEFLLSDIEQNIYRSKIRYIANTDNVTYMLILNAKLYPTLISMLTSRYEKLGARVNIIATPDNIVRRKKLERQHKEKTAYQLFDEWLSKQKVVRTVKAQTLKDEIGITKEQFRNINKLPQFTKYVRQSDKKGYYTIIV